MVDEYCAVLEPVARLLGIYDGYIGTDAASLNDEAVTKYGKANRIHAINSAAAACEAGGAHTLDQAKSEITLTFVVGRAFFFSCRPRAPASRAVQKNGEKWLE